MASLDCSSPHRSRDAASSAADAGDCHRHLTTLLTPLDDQPDRLAARLLYRFGSIGRIAQASELDLRQQAANGEKWVDALLMVRQLLHDGLREELIRTKLGTDRTALFSYLRMTMQDLHEERMIAIYADAEGWVIGEEIIAQGCDAQVLVTPRRILGRAMNLDARRILLAHNHPSGCAEPSKADIQQTHVLCRQARELGMVIEDHLIVGKRAIVSMTERGLI